MEELIESLGYLGAYLGAIMEGEILFITAIQMAQMGYMKFPLVLLAVFLGTISADWLFYLAGRTQGRRFMNRFPKLQSKFERMDQRMERYDTTLLFVYRFMYGFRIVLPVLFGARGIPPLRFALFNLLATSVWVALFGTLGYYFSDLVISKITAMQEYGWVFLLLVIGLVIYFAIGPIKKQNPNSNSNQNPNPK